MVHRPIKNAGFAFPSLTDTCPNMHLDWMLSFGLRLWFLPLLSTTKSTMVFQLDSTFVSPHHVFKVIMSILMCPFKPFSLVSISNKLTICTATKCPPQHSLASQKFLLICGSRCQLAFDGAELQLFHHHVASVVQHVL